MSLAPLDCYHTLQVHPRADPETITHVYRLLAKKYHPDTAPMNLKAPYEARMREINLAYETLGKPDTRQQYDDTRQQYDAANSASMDLASPQVQFEIAAVLAETASAGGEKRRCYKRSEEILRGILDSTFDEDVTHEALVRLAQVQYDGLESYADAAQSFERLLSLTADPEGRNELFFCISQSHVKNAERAQAISALDRLLTECQDAEVIRVAEVNRANLFRDLPDYEQALAAYEIVTRSYPGSQEAAFCHFQRARILDSHLSRWRDALAEYKIVMDNYSGYQWASDCKWRMDHIQRKHIEKKFFWE